MTPSFPWLVGLWGSAAALLIVLYLVREQRPKIFVPFLELFVRPEDQTRRESFRGRLRRPASLLLQLLILGLLAFALIECSQRLAPAGKTWVLVFDTGTAMEVPSGEGEETALDRAKRRGREWLGALGPADDIMIVEAAAIPQVTLGRTRDLEAARRTIDALAVKRAHSNLERGLELADKLAKPERRRIVLLTAGPENLEQRPELAVTMDRVARNPRTPNLEVRAFAARRAPRGAGAFDITFELLFEGPRSVTALVEIERLDSSGAGSGIVEAREVELTPNQPYRGEFRELNGVDLALSLSARVLGSEREIFLADNRAFATLAEERLIRVLCVGPESLYLKAALLSVIRSTIVQVQTLEYPPRTLDGAVQRFDLTVFSGDAPPRSAETGAALYFAATGPHAPTAADGKLKMFGFDESEREASVFRYFDPYELIALEGVGLQALEGDRVLGRSGRKAILVRGQRPEGPFLSLGFLPDASDLVLRPAFPLFVRGAVEELLGQDDAPWLPTLMPGRTVRLQVPEGGDSVFELHGPLDRGSSSMSRSARARGGALRLEFEEAGIYELRNARSRRLLAVNLGVDESKVSDAVISSVQVASGSDVSVPARPKWHRWLIIVGVSLALLEFFAFHRRWTV